MKQMKLHLFSEFLKIGHVLTLSIKCLELLVIWCAWNEHFLSFNGYIFWKVCHLIKQCSELLWINLFFCGWKMYSYKHCLCHMYCFSSLVQYKVGISTSCTGLTHKMWNKNIMEKWKSIAAYVKPAHTILSGVIFMVSFLKLLILATVVEFFKIIWLFWPIISCNLLRKHLSWL